MEQFGGYNGGILSRGILSGDFVLGGFCPGGFCPEDFVRRVLSGGGFCPRTVFLPQVSNIWWYLLGFQIFIILAKDRKFLVIYFLKS